MIYALAFKMAVKSTFHVIGAIAFIVGFGWFFWMIFSSFVKEVFF